MVRDYGGGGRLRGAAGLMVGVAVLAVTAVAAFYGYAYLRDQRKAADRASGFDFAGQACQPLTRAEFDARHLKIRNRFLYEDVQFGRAAGHADCAALKQGPLGLTTVPACQFTSPAALTAKAQNGERYWVVPVGEPATVFIDKGEPRCVKGSNFTIEGLIGR